MYAFGDPAIGVCEAQEEHYAGKAMRVMLIEQHLTAATTKFFTGPTFFAGRHSSSNID